MALSKKMHEALNEQVGREFLAHFMYRAIALDLYDKGYEGFSAWMEKHAGEEYGHAERLIAFLKDNDARIDLGGVPTLPTKWESVRDAVAAALEHEKKLTTDIHGLHRLAEEEGDLATVSMLDWFVSEQVEEEATVSEIVGQLRLIGSEGSGIYMKDRELAQRVFVAPTAAN